jgi:hypothetical protein
MTEEEFVFRGDLARTPLPEMLATIHRYGVPGVMEFTGEDGTTRLFFVDGDVIFATSSNRGESLGDYLLRKGRITEAQLKVSSQELQRCPGKRHGSILVQMGFLRSEELGIAVREQVQSILWNLFNWADGEVIFRVGRFRDDEVYQIKIPTPRAILSGCKHISDAKVVMARLGGRGTVFRRRPLPEHLANLHLETSERAILDMVDGRTTLVELCEKGPMNAGVNARVMYAFVNLHLVERVDPPSGGIKIQMRNSDG